MSEALIEALIAYKKNEIPIGCVIVDEENDKIIAKAHNLVETNKNPNSHAEMLAINIACQNLSTKNLSHCVIYITLEPCTMCASAIANARLGKIYYGLANKKHGAIENGIKFFTTDSSFYKPEIYHNIQQDLSFKIMKKFFSKIRKNNLS